MTEEHKEKLRSQLIAAGTAQLKKYIVAARADPAAFIEFVLRTPKGGRVSLEPFHREWLDFFKASRRVQVEAAKSHGKCLAADQRVHLADGLILPAKKLAIKNGGVHQVLTYSPELDAFGYERAFFGANGKKPIIRLTMQTGHLIERTGEEPLLTAEGFVPISKLKTGDCIAAPRSLPEPALPGKSASLSEARWLGIVTGMSADYCPTCTLNEPTPHIVPAIFRGSTSTVASFIGGFWDSCRSIGRSGGLISIKAACRPLLEGIQTLLLRLGVIGCLHPAPPDMFRLTLFDVMAKRLSDTLNSIRPRKELAEISPAAEHIPFNCKPHVDPNSQQLIWYNRIVAVEKLAPQQTYSIEIPANPVYVCEDVISHNTTILLGFLLWQIGSNPDIRIKLFTQSEDKARERLNMIAEMILTNKLVKLVFPHLKPNPKGPWHKRSIQVDRFITDKEPTVEASGIMGSVEGGRADLVVLDDVCVAEGTPIFTHRGLQYVEDLLPGDLVLNHEGSWSRLGAVHLTTADTLLRIEAVGTKRPLFVTENHPLYAARELRSRDSNVWSHPDFARADEMIGMSKCARRWMLAFPVCKRPIEPLDLDALWNHYELKNILPTSRASRSGVPSPVHTDLFWFIVGLWLAQGWTATQKLPSGCSYTTWFSLNADRTDLQDKLREFSASLNRSVCITKDGAKHAVRAIISDKALHDFLKTFRRKDGFKEAPSWLFCLEDDQLRQIICGYFNGDGTHGPRSMYRFSSVSFPLLAQMQFALTRFGLTANIAKGVMRPLSKNPLHEMSINPDFGDIILRKPAPISAQYTWAKIIDGHWLRPVRKVERIHGAFCVYNLSMVEGPHSYVGPLSAQKNCDYRTSLIYPQHREAIKKKIYAELLPMLEEDGRAISIATPHHQQDAVASLRRNSAWESYIFNVGTDEDIYLPLWPKRWPREALKRLREEVGPMEYDRAYRCKAVSQAISIIKPEHIQFYSSEQMPDPWELICIQAYDLALTQKKHSSYFAAVTILYDPDRHVIFVADAWHDKLGFTEQAEAIVKESSKWQPNRVIIEETGYQGALRAYLIDIAKEPIPIVAVSPGSKSKEIRMMETVPMFESGRILFNPRLDSSINHDVSARGDLIAQLVNFASATDKDLGDAFAYAVRGVKDFRTHEDDDEWASGDGMVTRLSIIGR